MSERTVASRALAELFRASMRASAASISPVTTRDAAGTFHGMAVTSASSLSMDPPSMMVAVNRSASVHPIIAASGRFCLNLMSECHESILERFSRSDLREARFAAEHWEEGPAGLPVLRGALTSQICAVETAHDHGTHTIFIGRVEHVIVPAATLAPLIWLDGSRAALAPSCKA